jgi:hypothetical protein
VSWSTVRYMISDIQYGGKVTDDHDRHLLNTYAKHWFGNWLFEPNYAFYKGYDMPIEVSLAKGTTKAATSWAYGKGWPWTP